MPPIVKRLKTRVRRNRHVFVLLALVLAVETPSFLAPPLGTARTSTPDQTQIFAITGVSANSSVTDVLEFVQSRHWSTIWVRGGRLCGERYDAFYIVADRATQHYRSDDGTEVVGVDADGMYRFDLKTKRLRTFIAPRPSVNLQPMATAMNRYQALDPTLAREGELLVATPLNDVINPSYWLRKELGFQAEHVENLGIVMLDSRRAVHLRAFFPPALAKEAYWDVFVDTRTGVVLRFEIAPLPGNPRYVLWVDDLQVDAPVSDLMMARPGR